MEDGVDTSRKGKRKANYSKHQKGENNVLIHEATEAKRVKKQFASEVHSANAKTFKSNSSKHSSKHVAEGVDVALQRNLKVKRCRKGNTVKESLQISGESSENEELPQSYSKRKTLKLKIRNSSDSGSSSESISDNEDQPQSSRKEKNNASTSDIQEKPQIFNKDKLITDNNSSRNTLRNSSDGESSSDKRGRTQRSSKEKLIRKFKDPINIKNNSSHSESSDDEEREKSNDECNEERGEESNSSDSELLDNEELEILEDGSNLASKEENDSNVMPKEDQLILIERIQQYIPDNDLRSYHFRLKQLEWHKVAFKDYTIDQCKQVWSQLFKRVRHYRLLQEITSDIREILKYTDLQAIKRNATKKTIKRHPAMPDQPMSAYIIFYTKNCAKLARRRPNLQGISLNEYIYEQYQQLSLKKKQQYDLMAIEMRKEYEVKMAKFYEEHPHVKKEKKVYRKKFKVQTEEPPKKTQSAFELFLASKITNQNQEDKTGFRKDCREKWKNLPESVKLPWINQAEEENIEYQKKLSGYMARHPRFVPEKPLKSCLTKVEKLIKAKLSGKPKKPPNTALHLFTSTILRSAENVPPKERLKYSSVKWKSLPQEEKDRYTQLLKRKQRRYEIDFKKYLETLPEDKRQEEIAQAVKKKPCRKV